MGCAPQRVVASLGQVLRCDDKNPQNGQGAQVSATREKQARLSHWFPGVRALRGSENLVL